VRLGTGYENWEVWQVIDKAVSATKL
jgi:hypothetical protein